MLRDEFGSTPSYGTLSSGNAAAGYNHTSRQYGGEKLSLKYNAEQCSVFFTKAHPPKEVRGHAPPEHFGT